MYTRLKETVKKIKLKHTIIFFTIFNIILVGLCFLSSKDSSNYEIVYEPYPVYKPDYVHEKQLPLLIAKMNTMFNSPPVNNQTVPATCQTLNPNFITPYDSEPVTGNGQKKEWIVDNITVKMIVFPAAFNGEQCITHNHYPFPTLGTTRIINNNDSTIYYKEYQVDGKPVWFIVTPETTNHDLISEANRIYENLRNFTFTIFGDIDDH